LKTMFIKNNTIISAITVDTTARGVYLTANAEAVLSLYCMYNQIVHYNGSSNIYDPGNLFINKTANITIARTV